MGVLQVFQSCSGGLFFYLINLVLFLSSRSSKPVTASVKGAGKVKVKVKVKEVDQQHRLLQRYTLYNH